jgi:hypothetical protein
MAQATHSPDPTHIGPGAGKADHTNGGYQPAAPAATGATAGIPGSWTPAGSTPPADVATLQGGSITANPNTGWTSGQYVQTGTAGAAGRATWTGTGWVGGAAPLAAKDEKAKKSSTEGKKSDDS